MRSGIFTDNIARSPINGTAAKVSSQGGCLDSESLEQKRDRLLSRANWLLGKIGERKKGEVKNEEHKSYGKERMDICLELSALNKQLKRHTFGEENRADHMDCVYSVMREQLSEFQYKNIMKLAREMFLDDEKQRQI